jgi:UDP-4-amino-4,6-dideoxy-L-N-acetyl-beta-L-altrosamine transaminase
MIKLFDPDTYNIDLSDFSNILHDEIVLEFEKNFCEYVGAKHACSINSATNAIFLLFLSKGESVNVPSMIPPVVLNALITSGNRINFTDDVTWIGGSYILHDFGNYKVIDSAQRVERDQFRKEANPSDLMFFSHYPTKPVGSCDGGMIVSDDPDKIRWLKEATMNGMSFSENNWDRSIKFPGYKMYMNSIQAFIANENLKKLDQNKEKLKEIRNYYNSELGIENSSDHLYRIEVKSNREFIQLMAKSDIVCGIHYAPMHLNPIYTEGQKFNCIDSEKAGSKTVSLPFHPNLDLEDASTVLKQTKRLWKK